MSGLCLKSFRSDVRLRRQLRSYELVHFLDLLEFAGERRDPTFIPAKRRDLLRLWMGFGSGEKSREKFDARLQRFHAVELIQLGEDGSILLTYLLDQYDEEDDDPDAQARGGGFSVRPSYTNGDGTYPPDGRQSNRVLSTGEAAVRKREYRQRRAEAGDGPASRSTHDISNTGENQNSAEKWDISTGNVPAFESKRPAVAAQMSHEMSHSQNGEMSQNVPDMSGTSLAGVSPNVNVSGVRKFINSLDSGNVNVNVADKPMSQNVPPHLGGNVPAQNVPPPPENVPAPAGSPRVPLRPGYQKLDMQVAWEIDVAKVIELTRDRKSRGFYIAAWKHCYNCGALESCWDKATEILADEIRNGPIPGQPGHIPASKRGASFTLTIKNLLASSGTPYLNGSYNQATLGEQNEVHRQVRESLAAGQESPGSGVIMPLDALPDYEEEE